MAKSNKSCSPLKLGRGRPTKYSDRAVRTARKYLFDCNDKNETPFIEELALKMDVDDSTLWHWANTHEDFKHIYDLLLTYQKLDLKRKALTGQYVSRIACILLSAEHGVVARQRNEIEATIKEDTPNDTLTPEQRAYVSEAITRAYEHVYSQPKS